MHGTSPQKRNVNTMRLPYLQAKSNHHHSENHACSPLASVCPLRLIHLPRIYPTFSHSSFSGVCTSTDRGEAWWAWIDTTILRHPSGRIHITTSSCVSWAGEWTASSQDLTFLPRNSTCVILAERSAKVVYSTQANAESTTVASVSVSGPLCYRLPRWRETPSWSTSLARCRSDTILALDG